ncbi:hypothetical protein F4810DRAFT_706730 [Camillea tinctor]|nr:hypothetical protein F4810DRAFT_706730 [Camillea tinctor]
MKPTTLILFLAARLTSVLSSPTSASNLISLPNSAPIIDPYSDDIDCGNLGYVNKSVLPAGIDPSKVRTCLEHPLSVEFRDMSPRGESSSSAPPFAERACYTGADEVGCTRGYCWKKCGDRESGEWCWTAEDGGFVSRGLYRVVPAGAAVDGWQEG